MSSAGREEPTGEYETFLSKKVILFLVIIGIFGLVLFGIQELLLKRSGYDGGLYESSPREVRIAGLVSDKDTLAPISGAKVTVQDSKLHCLTDQKGNFNITIPAFPPNSELIIHLSKEGYMPATDNYSEGELLKACGESNTDGGGLRIYLLKTTETDTVPESPYINWKGRINK